MTSDYEMIVHLVALLDYSERGNCRACDTAKDWGRPTVEFWPLRRCPYHEGQAASTRKAGAVRYRQIAEEIRSRVKDLPPGSVAPSESQIAREFNVAIGTARAALQVLERDGTVKAVHGVGRIVQKSF